MVSGFVIGNQHKDSRLVFRVAQAIVVHGTVTTAVSERQDGHFANLLTDLQHLVGLQVLDDKLIGTNEVFVLTHGVIDSFLITQLCRAVLHVHTNHTVWLNTDRFHQRPADKTVGAGNDVKRKTIRLQVVEHLKHGFVETLAVGHATETVGWLLRHTP